MAKGNGTARGQKCSDDKQVWELLGRKVAGRFRAATELPLISRRGV